MRWRSQIWAATAVAAVVAASTEASAGAIKTGASNDKISVETVFAFGNDQKPVVVEENGSKLNFVQVIQLGGAGPVGATIIQTGATNYANVMQTGGTTSAAIGQFGASNTANVMQMGDVTGTLLVQVGDMNRGSVSQFGRFNWAAIFQFGR
ncbi:curlin [Bradyrhizobium sp. CCGUVB1N3]|uniref:curlin n=1 Tax=Bradyrhizobium sp. CCGUVB1N3 TaxID=2949629 RepID=UPI0020B1D2BF|nr:curlin [Bradyrhizobium sp. CCGUVB1N3]MCP3477353.1 curlin [Bradyrhizobium sp. CCGUVB1N3]